MTAFELYEDVFLYMCRLNRWARMGAPLDYEKIRGELVGLLEQVERRTKDIAILKEHWKRLQAPVCFFIDDVISQSDMAIAATWRSNRLGRDASVVGEDKSLLVGDEDFFKQLDEILAMDVSEQTNEWLVVFYTCLGLGFQGMHYDKPQELQKYMRALWVRCRDYMLEDDIPRLIPQPYKATKRGRLAKPARENPLWRVLATVCLVSAAVGAYMLIYNHLVADRISDPLRLLRHAYEDNLSAEEITATAR